MFAESGRGYPVSTRHIILAYRRGYARFFGGYLCSPRVRGKNEFPPRVRILSLYPFRFHSLSRSRFLFLTQLVSNFLQNDISEAKEFSLEQDVEIRINNRVLLRGDERLRTRVRLTIPKKKDSRSKSAIRKNGVSNGAHDCGAKNLSFRPLFPREEGKRFQLTSPQLSSPLSPSSSAETRKLSPPLYEEGGPYRQIYVSLRIPFSRCLTRPLNHLPIRIELTTLRLLPTSTH